MNRRWLPVALLALVTITAGCAGVFGGQQQSELTPVSDIETPAPGVPAAESSSTQLQVDTDRLVAANDRVRTATSDTLVRNVTVRSSNGTMRIDRTRQYGTENATLERLRIVGGENLSSVVERGTLWTNGTEIWTRTQLSNGRSVVSPRIEDEVHPYGYGPDLETRVLTATTFTVEERANRSGAILRSDESFSMDPGLVALVTGPAWNATARLVIEDDGLVSGLDLSYETATSTSELEVSITHRIVSQGTTSVSRPDWVPTNTTGSDAPDSRPTPDG